jgi:hypothetical protein
MDSARRVGIRSEDRDPSTALPRAMRPATSLRVTEKKAGTQEIGPGIELAGCPDKLIERTAGLRPADSRGRLSLQKRLRGSSWPHRQVPHLG